MPTSHAVSISLKKQNGLDYSYVSTYEEIEVSLISPSKVPLRNEVGNIDDLASSIRQNGLIEPIVVRPLHDRFEIVAGNRRFFACKKLNFRRIPAVVQELSDNQAYEAALIENIQRKTLDPLEEAECFQRYCKEFGWGSESELALRIGKSQEYVSHRIRLLSLPESAKIALKTNLVSQAVAEEVAWISDPSDQNELLNIAVDHKLNRQQARQVARQIKNLENQDDESTWLPNSRMKLRPDEDAVIISRAILSIRVSMVRLDSLI
ncbi:MAG: ParB/RepB/Spo0J family partition protein, partial [archaeon]|nr:ParB/RepB/Spo0J family partition protein [archaeon]